MLETVERVEEKEEGSKDTRTAAEKAHDAVQTKRVSSVQRAVRQGLAWK